MYKIGFIGVGNMGRAILNGVIKSFPASEITFTCLSDSKRHSVSEEFGIRAAESNSKLAKNCEFIILGIKPQTFDSVFEEIKDSVNPEAVVISLAPGKSMSYIKEALGGSVRIVRAMPNTPALIGCGISGVCFNDDEYFAEEKEVIDNIFSSFGKYLRVSEDEIDAVVCASGSSPAYFYSFVEILADAVAGKGLSKESAINLAANAMIGAGKMILESGESPAVLRERVSSKGGTTLAGLDALYKNGFEEAIRKATDACYNRSRELSAGSSRKNSTSD